MNVIFFGTPEFAVFSLRAIVEHKSSSAPVHTIRAVVTQPDKKKGRTLKAVLPPVKLAALEYGIDVMQPESIKTEEFKNAIIAYKPDIIVVVAYGKIMPAGLLSLPVFGCVNVHPSLLPKYRGAAPIQWAIARGEVQTGVCTMQMDEGMDTGAVYKCVLVDIKEDDTYASLSKRLAQIGGTLLVETIDAIAVGSIGLTKQASVGVSMAPPVRKEDGLINWQMSATEIANRTRGFDPWPCTYTYINGKRVKLLSVVPLLDDLSTSKEVPGTIIKKDKEGFYIKTGEGIISIKELQPEGKKTMDYKAFLQGRLNHEGDALYVG